MGFSSAFEGLMKYGVRALTSEAEEWLTAIPVDRLY
jgi:hypothetical protein